MTATRTRWRQTTAKMTRRTEAGNSKDKVDRCKEHESDSSGSGKNNESGGHGNSEDDEAGGGRRR